MAKQPFQLKYQLPVPWQGLYIALTSPGNQLDSMERWLKTVRQSRHGSRLSWDELVEFWTREEPVWPQENQISSRLSIVPVLLHVSPTSQTRLLSFLYHHRVEIPKSSLESLCQTLDYFDGECSAGKRDNSDITVDIGDSGLSSLDWLNFWALKFRKFIESVRKTGNGHIGERKVYKFTVRNCEAKARILEKLQNQNGERCVTERNPWHSSAWQTHERDMIDTPGAELSSQYLSMDTSYLPLTQAHRQTPDSDDGDVSIISVIPAPGAKRPRLDMTLPDHDLSESTLGLAVGEKLQGVAQRLKDAWHRSPPDPVTPADLTALTLSSLSERESVCSYVDLGRVPESSLVAVAEVIAGLGEQLPLCHSGALAHTLLLERVLRLDVSGSIPLHQSCVSLSQAFPDAVVQHVLVPVLTSASLEVHHCDFIDKLTGENSGLRVKLLSCYLESRPVMSSAVVPLVHALLKGEHSVGATQVGSLLATLCGSAASLQDNLKFGKLLLDVVKTFSRQLSVTQVSSLQQIAMSHKTFLKKSIVAAIKKT